MIVKMLVGNWGFGALLMIASVSKGWGTLAFAFLSLVGLGLACLLSLAIPARRWTPKGVPACVVAYLVLFSLGYFLSFSRLLREAPTRAAMAAPFFFTALAGTAYWLDLRLAELMDRRARGKQHR